LTPDKKTAILKVDLLMGYREAWQREELQSSGNMLKTAKETFEKFNGKKAPDNINELLNGIPSAIEMFKALFDEMKTAGTENLIIDLSQNRGGDSFMAEILTYFLYGKKVLANILLEENHIVKYSPQYFKNQPWNNIDAINKLNSGVQSYQISEGDYDFGSERRAGILKTGPFDTIEVAKGMYYKHPSFLQEIVSGKYDHYYTPRNIIVVCSNGTFSSGFTFLRFMYKGGAKIVGSTSGQSANGFGPWIPVTLKNSGLKVVISYQVNNVFPETKGERRVIEPHYILTYKKLKSYNFDPNAEFVYALEILKSLK
jgi:hypothetical protein